MQVKQYELDSKNMDIPLHKTAARFYEYKLLELLNKGDIKEEIKYLFKDINDSDVQRRIFKKFVSIVNIETSGFCNRKCAYCPVGVHKRNDKSLFMESRVFEKIAGNLEELEFDGSINLNGYNEPLLDNNIIQHIETLRKCIGKSFISLNSNGDYLTKDMLYKLQKAGLNRINVTLHTMPNETYFDDKSMDKIQRFYKKLELPIQEAQLTSGISITTQVNIESLILLVNTVNWAKIGNDRGGEIKTLSIENRIEPCNRVLREVFIDFRGLAHLCCNVYYDNAKPIGNINTQTIQEIYSKNFAWRQKLFTYSNKPSPCNTCKDESLCDEKNKGIRESILKLK